MGTPSVPIPVRGHRPRSFLGVTAEHMELARTLAATGDYRADMRSPKWIGYAMAEKLDIPVFSMVETTTRSQVERMKSIIKAWMINKVLKVEKRKDKDGKDR